jgi:hypothetical protein
MIFLWIFFLLVIIWRLVVSTAHLSRIPRQVPWSGTGERFVPYLVMQIKGIWNMPDVMNSAYQKVWDDPLAPGPELKSYRSIVRMVKSAPLPYHSVVPRFFCPNTLYTG